MEGSPAVGPVGADAEGQGGGGHGNAARHRAHSRSSQVQNVGAVWPRSAQVR